MVLEKKSTKIGFVNTVEHWIIMFKDCPALKLADQRRRKKKCEKCGEMGHDIIDCLDESDIRVKKEIKQGNR